MALRNGPEADYEGFERALMARLKEAIVLFIPEIVELGAQHGLSEVEVERILDHAEKSGLGLRYEAFVYLEREKDG
jgi:hypothetical protein